MGRRPCGDLRYNGAMANTVLSHVEIDDRGIPRIRDTGTAVIMIAMDLLGRGWDAATIHDQYPYLTLGQIHAALGYYHDHKVEMDAEIAQSVEEDIAAEQASSGSALRRKLAAHGIE
jgi:uncharacterized protein (DUF433 family)